jgi:hypothetical protein
MSPSVPRLLTALALLLTLTALSAGQDTSKPNYTPAVKDIVALSQNLEARDVTERAARIVKEHDSCDISTIFRPGPRGPGIGALAKAGHRNSIEALVKDYAKKAPTAEELEQNQFDLMRTAKILQAMAELAPHRGPLVTNPKNLPEWAKVSAEFKVTTREFRDAVQGKDPERVRKAAMSLEGTCNRCHNLVF